MRARTVGRPLRLRRRGTEPPPRPRPEARLDEDRARREGGPNDRAQYGCACGYVFQADVSASVACPHCGAAQAW